MSTISQKIKAVVDLGLAPSLKREGFRRKGTNFSKRDGDLLQIVNVQSSQHNSALIPYLDEGRFTLNIGVHFTSVAKVLHGTDPMPADPKEHFCLLRRRVGMLMPAEADHWWTVTSRTNIEDLAAELKSAWHMYISPWLAKVGTVSGIAREIEEHPNAIGGSLATAAAAFIVIGQPEEASRLVNRQLEDLRAQLATCHPANTALLTGYIAELRRWASAQSLPGLKESE